jgi:hypothetical protein
LGQSVQSTRHYCEVAYVDALNKRMRRSGNDKVPGRGRGRAVACVEILVLWILIGSITASCRLGH